MTPTLAPIANNRGYHRLRTITYDDLTARLQSGSVRLYTYNAVLDTWESVQALSVNPPMPWGKEHKEQWLGIPLVNGRRRDEAFCHVRFGVDGCIESEQLQDVRIKP